MSGDGRRRVRAVVLSDTHIRTGGRRRLPGPVVEALADADVVLHAGDVLDADVLDALAESAPVHAVLGNNDDGLVGRLPERLEVTLAGVKVGMVHDSGSAKGREARMRRWFPDADVVVFGHSHIPWDAPGEDGQWLFNPGSPTDRRPQPNHTFGLLEFEEGQLVDHRIVVAD
ncbi:MAG TPA: metallophosphoesterase family protein [Acidimicrobiia bacterium]|nr:metallophosphoesterase family protein [Acidimicrobiia bacterium]